MIWKLWGEHPKGVPVLAGWRYPDMWRFAVAMEETGRRAGRIYAGLSDVTDEPPTVFAEIDLPGAEPAPVPPDRHIRWSCGRLLVTNMTLRMTEDRRQALAAEERRMVFDNFFGGDEGQSRRLIAMCSTEEYAAHIVRVRNAHEPMLEILKTTAGNIRSLGPAGKLASEYEVWLAEVEAAIAKADG